MHLYDSINQAAGLIVPEIILIATVCLMFLAAPFLVNEAGQASSGLRHRWGILSLLALGCSLYALSRSSLSTTTIGPFHVDQLAMYVRGMTLIGGILLTLILWDQIDDGRAAEAHACLLAIIAGVNFVVVGNDLVSLFLGLELVSIPTYVLLMLPRRDWLSREATIKYFLLSIFSSAFVLYGMSWVFGLAGTTNLNAIAARVQSGGLASDTQMFRVAMVLIIAGLSFRLTAVPFHFYAPDVFQGVTPSAAGMLSFIPKVAGFAALLRLLPVCFGASVVNWVPAEAVRMMLTGLALLTMIVGNLLALRQTNLLRLMAYSSVAHAGYMLVGLAMGGNAGGTSGTTALLFYLASYGLMTLGVFAALASASSPEAPLRAVGDLAGLSRRSPAAALMLAVCIFGLSGLPPTGGFFAKLHLFFAAWSDGSQDGRTLAIVLAINAVIAAAYYLRLISVMYLETSTLLPSESKQPAATVASMICAVSAFVLFLKPQLLWSAASLIAAGP
ncbi:MAG: NADH-quinone oxidoreductase subunit N [Planctomyces sp.]|nr:NADH-quinone oxidoreductase subunit N [Planctomyces sp.]